MNASFFGNEVTKPFRSYVFVEIIGQCEQAGRIVRGGTQPVAQRSNCVAVRVDGFQEPGIPLVAVTNLVRPFQNVSHVGEALSERGYGRKQLRLVQISEDVLPVADGVDVLERRNEKGKEVVFRFVFDKSVDDLIEIEVEEVVRGLRGQAVGHTTVLKKDAEQDACRGALAIPR